MSAAPELQLGAGFSIPVSAVTQTFGLVGKRGVGKTATAGVLAEEMLERQLQVVILDPIGVWWGLRTTASGKGQGYSILVLGGDHGDLPLEAAAGKLVGDFVVTKRASVVLDMGLLSKSDQARFVTEFLERLYQSNRAPLHLVIDEADAFAPQRLHHGAERCFGAVDTVVRRGRARGLGVTLVTQRSAALNKDVLTQIEVLIAFRTIAPQDRAAIEAWVEVHGDAAGRATMLASLHMLGVGECWIWSPAWLETLKRVQIRRRRTFDSSATPEVGRAAAAPRAIAAVDVAAFRTELASLVQKADQEDPRRLRARIATLERELSAKPAAPAPGPERVEVPLIAPAVLKRLDAAAAACGVLAERLANVQTELHALRALASAQNRFTSSAPRELGVGHVLAAGHAPAPAAARTTPAGPVANGATADIGGKAERAILTVLAQHPEGCDAPRLTLLAGYRWSGGFRNALSALRAGGLISGGNAGLMTLAPAGAAALGDRWDPLPRGAALVEYWLRHPALGAAERSVLDTLARVHPRGLNAEQLMAKTGYSWSGGFRNALSRLRTAGLLVGRNGEEMHASENLFT